MVALSALLAVTLGVLALAAWPRSYVSTTSFFVSLEPPTQMQSYAALADGPALARAVVNALSLAMPVQEVQSRISARVESEGVLLDVSVRGSSSAQAYVMATTIGQVFPRLVRAADGTAAPSRRTISVAQPATLPRAPDRPTLPLTLVTALAIGAGFGLAAATIRNRVRTNQLFTSVRREETCEGLGRPLPGSAGEQAVGDRVDHQAQ